MSLRFDLKIGRRIIGNMEIVRITNTGANFLPEDMVSRYNVIVDKVSVGTVDHRYGDGAWKLLAKAVELACKD